VVGQHLRIKLEKHQNIREVSPEDMDKVFKKTHEVVVEVEEVFMV
jgi:hypothetical protein